MEVKIYYGISGTFKTTTIQSSCKKEDIVMRSSIKTWKGYRNKLFPWLSSETNLNYALLHLTRLEDFVLSSEGKDLIIERGISDMMFYELSKSFKINSSVIWSAVNQESEIIGNKGIQKILLVMKDAEFIAESILSEPTRASCFRDTSDYLEQQERYIDFTKTYNNITEEIKIENAREYLGELGIEYINNPK